MLEIGRPQENWRVLSPTIGRHYVRNFNLPVGKWRRPPCVVIRCDDRCSIIIQWSPGGLCEVCDWVNNSNKLTMWSFFFRFHFAPLPFLCAFSLLSVSSLSPRFGLGLTQRLCSKMARVRRAQRWRCIFCSSCYSLCFSLAWCQWRSADRCSSSATDMICLSPRFT